jgi:uncharacterized protein YkwD
VHFPLRNSSKISPTTNRSRRRNSATLLSRFAVVTTLSIIGTTWFSAGTVNNIAEFGPTSQPTGAQVLGETRYQADSAAEVALFEATNRDRSKNRRRAFVRNAELDALAATYVQSLANTRLVHAADLSMGVTQTWAKLGENLGRGRDPIPLHLALMASPAHRANLLDSGFTQIGIAAIKTDAGIVIVERFLQPPA